VVLADVSHVAARSKSRKKAKAAKRSRPRRAPAEGIETPSPPLLPAAQVEIIEIPPDPPLQPHPVDVIGTPPDVPLHLASVNVHEVLSASTQRMPEAILIEPQPEPPLPAAEEGPPKPIKILLVEDGNFLRLEIQRALVRAGYAVVTASDGEAAIEAARKSQPDLILLDLLLPRIGGQDVLKTLKKDPETASISVVVLTGLSQMNAERLQADGALAFFEKSDLGLDKGSEVLLAALSAIVQQLPCGRRRKRAAAAPSR
jgi:CheY-like chemotaxis protein